MKIEKETLTITYHGKPTTFICDRRDTDDLYAIVGYWKGTGVKSIVS